MFLETPDSNKQKKGWVEVICGSMFSGKTEELIRRLKRAQFAQQKIEIFKPLIDVRYDKKKVISHDQNEIISTPVSTSSEILDLINEADVVGIDEAQFFDSKLPNTCNALAKEGVRVIVAGLDMDYLGNPFGPIPNLMATAEFVSKVHAICVDCGDLAIHSNRIVASKDLVHLGEKEEYEALCRSCFILKNS